MAPIPGSPVVGLGFQGFRTTPVCCAAMTWEPELDELRRRQELARQMGGAERVERQRASGRITLRERVRRPAVRGAAEKQAMRRPQLRAVGRPRNTSLLSVAWRA